jgi:hypothetical protein
MRRAPSHNPEALLEWAVRFHRVFDELQSLRRRLERLHMEPEMFERLAAWAAESGSFELDRLRWISNFFESLKDGPFSTNFRVRRFRQFLDETVGAGAGSYAAAAPWF